MLTPEAIEGIPADNLKMICDTAAELHEATAGTLDMLSPEDVGQQEALRAAMKLKIDEARSLQTKRINDMRSLNKELEIARDRQSNDKERIRSHKISLYVARKEGRA